MIYLAILFFFMFVYGAFIGQLGAACLALFMSCFVILARGWFAEQDAAAEKDPARAKCPKTTEQCLCDGECECTRDSI
jgi:hypothetical protein